MDPRSRSRFGRIAGLQGLSHFPLRQLIAWGDHLKLGQPQIDAEHEAIFDLALEIMDAWHKRGDMDQVRKLTQGLHETLEAHFRHEERQLAEIGYTKLVEHRAEHKLMLDELQIIRYRLARMEQGTSQPELGFLVLSYIISVTVGHIFHSDMDYCDFARAGAHEDGPVRRLRDPEAGAQFPAHAGPARLALKGFTD